MIEPMPFFHLSDSEFIKLEETSFAELRIQERADLQRLLCAQLDVIAPDCKLVTDEFGDWEDSQRRIDILAIDADGNLVVIELKRTKDGGHLELQALRYAAMVSTMSFEQVVAAHADYLRRSALAGDARADLLAFLGWEEPVTERFAADVRIVLVSADFSKEITTTVLWLNEHDLDVRCVRMCPYVFDGKTLLHVEQLIPLPEAAEYQVRVRQREEQRRANVASSTNRDFTKFDVTVGAQTEEQLNKRKALLAVVRALTASGVAPERIAPLTPKQTFLFASAEGTLSAADFRQMMERQPPFGRAFDARRWFCGDGELIHSGGRTYAVSNQWGVDTHDVMLRLTQAFPEVGVHVRVAETTE
jgi:hypothetical protein